MHSAARPPPGTNLPAQSNHSRSLSQPRRSPSSSSDSSSSSQTTPQASLRRSPFAPAPGPTANASRGARPTTPHAWGHAPPAQNFSRPSIAHVHSSDGTPRGPSPLTVQASSITHPPHHGHHHSQGNHSQGFFEPSLPTANHQLQMAPLNASQIAAQAAMQNQSSPQHLRKRSQTTPSPQSPPDRARGARKPAVPTPIQVGPTTSNGFPLVHGPLVGSSIAAATAANAAYPRATHTSPGHAPPDPVVPPVPKAKPEKSKMKLFSKPKSIGITKGELDAKDRPLPSPNKSFGGSPFPRLTSASSTSLTDPMASSSNTSIYSSAHPSTATLVPNQEKGSGGERPKHHFLSRQKHKVKDDHHLPLSSASSNSKPLDPSAPQSLYSFAPSTPSPATTTFAKSVSGLDLRHGGRALREKKREEKASAHETTDPGSEWPGPSRDGAGGGALFSPAAGGLLLPHHPVASSFHDALGLPGLPASGPPADDSWPFLRATLLVLFQGEDLRVPVEDLTRLVSTHLQRCIQKRAPGLMVDDLRDLLATGFGYLDQTLRAVPDERLVRALVDMWLVVFGTILPYLQAVFLPLDLEFRGHGPLLSARDAAEFWGAEMDADRGLGDALDVRRLVLLAYRDAVILPRHDTLKAIFSRLSLESIHGGPTAATPPDALRGPTPDPLSARPGTAMSLDPGLASYNSQGSTLLGESGASFGARSRATSNTSSAFGGPPSSLGDSSSPRSRPPFAPSWMAPLPPLPPPSAAGGANADAAPDSARITETVGRMLQCVAVLGSVQSNADAEAQSKMEGLAKTLKLNWLGRGRTGRNRRGFVGTRVVPGPSPGTATRTINGFGGGGGMGDGHGNGGVGAGGDAGRGAGSPTPTSTPNGRMGKMDDMGWNGTRL
ncbi:MAG: hypothetical protein M1838_000743 [Thelocarpon superellum]|nr:MAG: hypothetical protein M1838_000743 [Thelocarpon superellum]